MLIMTRSRRFNRIKLIKFLAVRFSPVQRHYQAICVKNLASLTM
uniref:Uncharacterized protein n=1 Tax=Arundo donax TaxID=35708 RepID=A0A0A9DYW0_ARUDO